ncbi:MAG: PAS domain-containing protein [Nitrospirae bacterium]|nr:PAS domain-containing protein [Nitrospirota bacterium]MBF0535695.1 PAS domain-containing protein [Nitrospirota bacterium]MBF0617520.1 PAS domain-containing protein [Nitrospirota bacterium]
MTAGKRLSLRILTICTIMAVSSGLFDLIATFVIKNPLYDSNFKVYILTYAFIAFTLIGACITVIFIYRDYRKKKRFLEEIKLFSEIVYHGSFEDRVYFEDYPDLAEVYQFINNITKNLKRKSEQTEEERSQLDAILESIPDALLIIDNRDGVVYLNDRAREMFDYKSTPVSRTLIEIIRSFNLNVMLENVKRFDKSESGEIFLEHPGEKYLMVRMSPFYKKNDLSGVVVLFHDITELKKLETMRKDFVANVSHEIRTPVTAIKGFAETLIEGALTDKKNAVRFLNSIVFHSERLNRLVEDLLTISSIELGVIRINKQAINLIEVVDTVVETLRAKGLEKSLNIKTAFTSSNISLVADRDKVVQVLINLIDNAIKFTQSGTIEIGVNEDTFRFCLYVKDTGVGIPKKSLTRIGERFYRVDPSRSRELGGTGLGLAIVKHIVRAHDWELKFESAEGAGTTVKILIPKSEIRIDVNP